MEEREKKRLRGLGHPLKAVVLIGSAGLTGAVKLEIESALTAHELIKIKIRVGDRQKRDTTITEICAGNGAELIQRVGNTAVLYRQNPDQT